MVIDRDILIDCARKDPKAIEFLESALRKDVAKVNAVSHMELIVGCRNKRELTALDRFIARFDAMTEKDKQDALWQIIDGTDLTDAEKVLISLVMPVSPAEVK